MFVISSLETEQQNIPSTALGLGYFDGVHLGHRKVIKTAVQYAKQNNLSPAVFTFILPVKQSIKGQALSSFAQKYSILDSLGIDYCFEPEFSEISSLDPRRFFEEVLIGKYKAKALFCGNNFVFGANRAGDVKLLERLCKENGVQLFALPMATYNGEDVSSSRIRAYMQVGDFKAVNAMLARPYEICLPVMRGKQLGKKLGFPTINQHIPTRMQQPVSGVYITKAVVDDTVYPAVTSVGTQPTVGGENIVVETYIPNFSGNLYGKVIPVQFYKKIGDIKKFGSLELLTNAVLDWAKEALLYFET